MRWSHNPSVHYGLQGKYCSQSRFLAYRALYSSTFHERRADGTPPNEVAGLPSTWTHYPSPDSARCTYLLLILSDLWGISNRTVMPWVALYTTIITLAMHFALSSLSL